MSNITTGRNVASVVKITSATAVDLVLAGTEQSLTSTITAEVTDNFGNTIADVPLTFTSSDPSVAEVDLDTGVSTAIAPGQAVIEVSAPFGNNSIMATNPNGTPISKIYSNVLVSVTEYGSGQAIEPDFSFTLDSDSYTVSSNGTFSVTITQTAENGFGDGTVGYQLTTNYPIYPPSQPPSQPLPTLGYHFYTPSGGIPVTIAGNLGGTISGSGTLTLNFQAQDAPTGTVPLIVYGYSPVFYNVPGADLNVPVRTHVATATLTVS